MSLKVKAAFVTLGVLLLVASIIGALFGVLFLADKLFGSPQGSIGIVIVFSSMIVIWVSYGTTLQYLEKKDAARIK